MTSRLKVKHPLQKRPIQEVLSSFPAAVLIDVTGLNCETGLAIVKPGETGYYPYYPPCNRYTFPELAEIVAAANQTRVATAAEREAALIGSMMGWHVPGADPINYDPESGT